ncbi:MAG: pseudaminic acid cytidylyltransferase [Bacteroidota bacterium]
MKKLAIIPARGGSKRIPRKNVKDFCGKPIVSYSIEIALKSGLFDEVMVSTDDDEIAEISKSFGASVPFLRSKKKSDDFATTVDVIQEVLRSYSEIKKHFDYVCCIYATAPLINVESIIKGFDKLVREKRVSVFPVVEFSYPIWRGVSIKEGGKVEMIWPKFLNARSQDLDKVYHDAGQWYWINNELFASDRNLFSANSGCIELSEMNVQDIDNETDWLLAELKFKILN